MDIQCWIIILYMVELGSTLRHVRNRVKVWSATLRNVYFCIFKLFHPFCRLGYGV